MPEVTIKYKNAKALNALMDLAKYLDFVVEKTKPEVMPDQTRQGSLPIVFSKKPDVTALAGIWKNKDISLTELRKKAWGNRL